MCGTRYWVGASCGCSGVTQKIHTRKIRQGQGLVHDEEFGDFRGLGTFDEAKWTFQGPGVRADAQWDLVHGSKNLFQKAILYRHKRNNIRPG